MSKKIIFMLFVLVSLLLSSSCRGGILISEEKKADARLEQIISAIKDKDKESLKSLFSKRALDEANDFEKDVDYLFKLIQGKFDTWERTSWSSGESVQYGKKSLMIRFGFYVKTDKDMYSFYVIDYNTDTINPDNQGVCMLELVKFTDEKDLEAWQKRMRAGVYIH